MAIADDVSIDYTLKRVDYIGSYTSGVPDSVYTGQELYTYLQDEFDELSQLDDQVPLDYDSPSTTALQLKWVNDWYGTMALHQMLTGCSTKQDLTESGAIRKLTLASGGYTSAILTDIGKTVTGGTTGDTGVLLDYDNTTRTWYIRPDDPATDLFDNGSEALTIGSGTGAGDMAAVSEQGQTLYAEVRTIGNLNSADSLVYIEQNNVRIVAPAQPRDAGGNEWWTVSSHIPSNVSSILPGAPHIDVLVKVRDAGALIDFGFITVYQRKYGEFSSSFVLNCSGGGNNVLALSTGADANNDTAEGTVSGYTAVTITGSFHTRDLGNGNGAKEYAITLNCNGLTPKQAYEYTRYLTDIGSTGTIITIPGQLYRGITRKLLYDNESGTFTQGLVITGGTSGATAVIAALDDDGTTGTMWLVGVRGTFQNNEEITDTSTGVADVNGAPTAISPVESNPFGTFAGGKWSGAHGVDITNFSGAVSDGLTSLIALDGSTQSPPNTVSVTIGNLLSGDRIGVYRLDGAGGDIIYNRLAATLADNDIGDTAIVAKTSIASDEPTAGYVRIAGDLYHYDSFASATFTLSTVPGGTATSTHAGTQLTDTAATFVTDGVAPGMMIRNTTDGSYATILSVTSETVLTHTALTGGTGDNWDISDAYTINQLVQNYAEDAEIFIPFIDAEAGGSSLSNSLIYASDIPVRAVVRRYNGAGDSIRPFSNDGTIASTGLAINAIRTSDEVVT